MNRVEVFSLNKKYRSSEKILQRILEKSLQLLRKDKISLEVYLVDNLRMKKLNQRFKNSNKVISVLSFPSAGFPRPDSRLKNVGEIYLAPDYIKTKKQDAVSLAVHGLLHLLGYTHGKKGDRIRMEKKEAWLMSLLP